jgi:hypothetical protein
MIDAWIMKVMYVIANFGTISRKKTYHLFKASEDKTCHFFTESLEIAIKKAMEIAEKSPGNEIIGIFKTVMDVDNHGFFSDDNLVMYMTRKGWKSKGKLMPSITVDSLVLNVAPIVSMAKGERWKRIARSVEKKNVAVHLAVLKEPYLTLLVEKKKTIESRFSVNNIAPHGRVTAGDVLLLKKSGGTISNVVEVGKVREFTINSRSDLIEIKERFRDSLCIEDSFWKEKSRSKYATLMEVVDVQGIDPIRLIKTDGRPWIVLQERRKDKDLFSFTSLPR